MACWFPLHISLVIIQICNPVFTHLNIRKTFLDLYQWFAFSFSQSLVLSLSFPDYNWSIICASLWPIIVLWSRGKLNGMSKKKVFRDCKLIHVEIVWLCKADSQTEFHCLLWNQTLSLLKQDHNAWTTHKNVTKVKEYKTRSSFKPRSKTSNTDSSQQALNGPSSTHLPVEIPLYN